MKTTIEELRRQIKIKDDALHNKNLELDAMHYVWCSGGCKTGLHRWHKDEKVNEELVLRAERNVARLRAYWENKKYRELLQEKK